MPISHVPVLCDQVVTLLVPPEPGVLVDVTVGLGGHAAALLEASPGCTLLGLDRDPEALELARQNLAPFADRVRLVLSGFDALPQVLAELDAPPPAAILADLGCSSLQLDRPERGFSFLADGPLDMRMSGSGESAADLVNGADEEELMRILWDYGEERRSRAIARAIVRRRQEESFASTSDLAALVAAVVRQKQARIHPATRTFQALRIAVNDELGQLERFVEPALRALRPGGRLAVISFHSLEDRIVKHTLRSLEGRCVCPPEIPVCVCDREAVGRVLTRRPIRPDDQEIDLNPRSRSARLRVAEKGS